MFGASGCVPLIGHQAAAAAAAAATTTTTAVAVVVVPKSLANLVK